MDQQKQIKQLESKIAHLEKVVQLLLNQNRKLDVEVRRIKHNQSRTQHQVTTVERKLGRGAE